MSKYLLKNANICDIKEKNFQKKDIQVEFGIITEISDFINEQKEETVIDINGKFLSQGWIDAHAHLYINDDLGISQDIMLYSGVTFAVDAGTAGSLNFQDFLESSLKKSKLPAKSYLNIAPYGVGKQGVELKDLSKVDVNACLEAVKNFKNYIIGIKLRIDPRVCEDSEKAMKIAKEISQKAGLPLIVHASRTLMSMEKVLSFLDKGDVFAHTYANKTPGLLDKNSKVKKCAFEARERGVFFDVSHGKSNFSFDVIAKAVEQNFLPDVISTDLHKGSLNVVYDLPTTMSKVMACGVDFWNVLTMVTDNAAKMLGLETHEIAKGDLANFTVFDVKDGDFSFSDADGNIKKSEKKFEPYLTIIKDEIFLANNRT